MSRHKPVQNLSNTQYDIMLSRPHGNPNIEEPGSVSTGLAEEASSVESPVNLQYSEEEQLISLRTAG